MEDTTIPIIRCTSELTTQLYGNNCIHLAAVGPQGQSGVALKVRNIVRRPWNFRVKPGDKLAHRVHGPGTTSSNGLAAFLPADGERDWRIPASLPAPDFGFVVVSVCLLSGAPQKSDIHCCLGLSSHSTQVRK